MGFLDKIFGTKETSAAVAKDRLQMVLVHDRSAVSPGMLEQIKDDIIEVIARRLTIDPDAVEVNIAQSARESCLVAEIPLVAINGRKSK